MAAKRLTISSWFKLPDQGMKDFELLSRASSFLVSSPMGKLFVTGAAHVYQPFQFPKLYPNEMAWMKFIKPTNCKYELEFRDIRKQIQNNLKFSIDLKNVNLHQQKDFALAQIANEEEFFRQLSSLNFQRDDVLISIANRPPIIGEEVSCSGFVVQNSGLEDETQKYTETRGRVSYSGYSYNFIENLDLLPEMGMCGGPVLNSVGECIGIIEGLVNPPSIGSTSNVNNNQSISQQLQSTFRDHTAFVSSTQIIEFMTKLSNETTSD